MDFEILRQLSYKTDSKIVLLVVDGLGGLPYGQEGKTELEAAQAPEFDTLAARSSLGLIDTVSPGITPGSGPGHLGLFGYDPLQYQVGRGVLAALGVNFDLQASDVAARINFCTLDGEGRVSDRRAGRIPTEKCEELVALLDDITIEGVRCFVVPVREYRAALIMRGEGLEGDLTDTDPQTTGVAPKEVKARSEKSKKAARIANLFIAEARRRLEGQKPANGLLLRGFDSYTPIESFEDIYHLKGAAIAVYPMYRGVSRLVGMDIIETGPTIEDEFDALIENFDHYDFFYIHIKKSDSYGEDGNFDGKVDIIRQVSAQLPRLLELAPQVLAITGDHSTPASFKAHTWHPVPLLVHSPYVRRHGKAVFNERECAQGDLGRIRGKELMTLLLANGGKLKKFGA